MRGPCRLVNWDNSSRYVLFPNIGNISVSRPKETLSLRAASSIARCSRSSHEESGRRCNGWSSSGVDDFVVSLASNSSDGAWQTLEVRVGLVGEPWRCEVGGWIGS